MSKLDRDLDRALAGRSDPDKELVGLVETARVLTQAFDLEPEPALRERALFAAAVGARGRSGFPLVRLFAPVAAGLGLLAALGFASRSAMPGDALYPVRKVLQGVGLNEGVLEDAVARMDQAEALLDEAEDLLGDRNARAATLAVKAIQVLAPVDDLLQETDLSSEELAGNRSRLAALIERGTSVIATTEEGSEEVGDQRGADGSTGEGEHDEDDGRSGSDDEDDSSGPGSGDGDDSSGSDSDDGDDRSGSGDGDGDDSSGSDSDDGDDRSGSGDGDGDDSSGSDSDDKDDRSGSDDGEDRSGSDDDLIDSLDDRELDDDSEADAEDSLD